MKSFIVPANKIASARSNTTDVEISISKPRRSRIHADRQNYPSYAKIRHMRSEIKRFGTIVSEILSEICEDPTYTSPTYARFTVFPLRFFRQSDELRSRVGTRLNAESYSDY